jgi:hypothetical protein
MNKSIRSILIALSISICSFGLQAAEEHGHDAHAHGSEMPASGLSLNDGKRWEMDDHTRKMSLKMSKTFFNSDHSSQASLSAMGAKLENQLNQLIAGCTMDGEAHKQLHVFLADYIPNIKSLTEAKDLDMARDSAIKLKANLETYEKHFK